MDYTFTIKSILKIIFLIFSVDLETSLLSRLDHPTWSLKSLGEALLSLLILV